MGLIAAQLGENTPTQTKQLTIYRLKHGRATQMVEILAKFISREETVVADQDTHSIIVHAKSDSHAQLQQLIKELDTPRTSEPPKGFDTTCEGPRCLAP
ncbi:MAG: hypothetical protein GY809_22530 [Planctomycetes bacterium]|nr:hypothetical protein [Planctomycetota bacterium]